MSGGARGDGATCQRLRLRVRFQLHVASLPTTHSALAKNTGTLNLSAERSASTSAFVKHFWTDPPSDETDEEASASDGGGGGVAIGHKAPPWGRGDGGDDGVRDVA